MINVAGNAVTARSLARGEGPLPSSTKGTNERLIVAATAGSAKVPCFILTQYAHCLAVTNTSSGRPCSCELFQAVATSECQAIGVTSAARACPQASKVSIAIQF